MGWRSWPSNEPFLSDGQRTEKRASAFLLAPKAWPRPLYLLSCPLFYSVYLQGTHVPMLRSAPSREDSSRPWGHIQSSYCVMGPGHMLLCTKLCLQLRATGGFSPLLTISVSRPKHRKTGPWSQKPNPASLTPGYRDKLGGFKQQKCTLSSLWRPEI